MSCIFLDKGFRYNKLTTKFFLAKIRPNTYYLVEKTEKKPLRYRVNQLIHKFPK